MSRLTPPLTPLRCALCGGPMKLVRTTSAPDAQSQLALYRCEKCRHTVTRPLEPSE
jgi:hypothetical protein